MKCGYVHATKYKAAITPKIKHCKTCKSVIYGSKKYCSKECRPKYWDKAARECKACSKAFNPQRRTQTYCSSQCWPSSVYKSHSGTNGFYNSKEWKEIRRQFFTIAINNQCIICLDKGTLNKAYALDHKIPRKQGGTEDWSNLQGLCKHHHQSKSAQEGNLLRG